MAKKRRRTEHEVLWNSWADQGAVDEILARILKSRAIEADGLYFRGLSLSSNVALLTLALDFGPHVTQEQRFAIVNRAVREVFKHNEVPRGRFLEAVRQARIAYFALPLREYRVVGTLTAKPPPKPLRRRMGGSTIEITSVRPDWAPVPRLFSPRPIENDYAVVVGRCSAVNLSDAFNAVIDQVDLLRASWNLSLNYRRSSRNSGGLRPQNAVYWGSVVTVHDQDGQLVPGGKFYDDDHPPPITVKNLDDHWDDLTRTERWVRSRLRESRHREFLRGMLLRYVRALDEKEPSRALLSLWNLLEYLTGKPKNYDVLIERASYFFVERSQVKFELECARNLRNEKTHGAPGAIPHSLAESLVGDVKSIVDAICHHHLSSLGEFGDLDDCWEVLGSSHSVIATQAMVQKAKHDLRIARQADSLARRLGTEVHELDKSE